MKRLERGESLGGGVSGKELASFRAELLNSQRKTRAVVFAAGALVAAALIYGYTPSQSHWLGLPPLSWLLTALGAVSLWRSR